MAVMTPLAAMAATVTALALPAVVVYLDARRMWRRAQQASIRAEAELVSAQQIGTQVSVAYENTQTELAKARGLREQTERVWREAERFVGGAS